MAYGGSLTTDMSGAMASAPGTASMPMAAVSTRKPHCGGGAADQSNYDLPLHIVTLCQFPFPRHMMALTNSIWSSCWEQVYSVSYSSQRLTPGTGAGSPVVAKMVKWMKIPPNVFFFCKHFGTGVLIATAFVHASTSHNQIKLVLKV